MMASPNLETPARVPRRQLIEVVLLEHGEKKLFALILMICTPKTFFNL